jgi:hypothetical protein
MTMGRRTGVAIVAALAGLVAVPATASADSVVIGSALKLPYAGGVSTAAGTTSVQISQVGGNSPHPLKSPVDGVVTEWAVRTGDPDTLYVLRILRPNGGNSYTSVARVAAPTAVPPGTTDSTIRYSGKNLPIRKGDAIGLLQNGNPDVGIAQAMTNGIATNVFANHFPPDFADGVPATFMPDQQHELLLQATIQFQPAANKPALCTVPALKGLKLAAARETLTAAKCGAANVTRKRLKRTKKNKKRKGKVLSQSPAAGEIVAAGTPVSLKVAGLKKKKKKHK